jgi:hypothetical protein
VVFLEMAHHLHLAVVVGVVPLLRVRWLHLVLVMGLVAVGVLRALLAQELPASSSSKNSINRRLK